MSSKITLFIEDGIVKIYCGSLEVIQQNHWWFT